MSEGQKHEELKQEKKPATLKPCARRRWKLESTISLPLLLSLILCFFSNPRNFSTYCTSIMLFIICIMNCIIFYKIWFQMEDSKKKQQGRSRTRAGMGEEAAHSQAKDLVESNFFYQGSNYFVSPLYTNQFYNILFI